MSGLGTKTPVSYLQEYLVSKKIIPQYELTKTDGGSHNPEFTYRVQVQSLWEEGKGKSKQEAKHQAAEKMLKSLKIIDANTEEEETTEVRNEPMENYVGSLKELCLNLHYPEPKYYLEEAAGPPHSRIFKMICCVSQMQDSGISKTKKHAKQKAAFSMLQRLKEVGGKKIEKALVQKESANKLGASSVTDEEINEKYNKLKSINAPVVQDPVAFYKDNHKAYVGLQESSPTLMKVLNEKVTEVEDSLGLVKEIAKELEADMTVVEVPSKEDDMKFSIMTMSICPPIGGVGLSEKSAAFNLLNSLLFLCKE